MFLESSLYDQLQAILLTLHLNLYPPNKLDFQEIHAMEMHHG